MNHKIKQWKVHTLGDHAIVFALEQKISPLIVNEIAALHSFIISKKINGIIDIIPAYHTLTLVYDIINFTKNNASISEQINLLCTNLLNEFNNTPKITNSIQNTLIHVPVCYEPSFALDIQNISTLHHIAISEIIKIHSSKIYEIYSIGFLPGFAYMGIVDEKIQTPRHDKPRPLVPAGSVGIAGQQTGIYPSDSPGGWQILGRTPWKIFDPNENKLAKFKVGDQIKFYAITVADFIKMNEHQ
jgi:inhibitor of KinA